MIIGIIAIFSPGIIRNIWPFIKFKTKIIAFKYTKITDIFYFFPFWQKYFLNFFLPKSNGLVINKAFTQLFFVRFQFK